MTVAFHKFTMVVAALTLLTGCTLFSGEPAPAPAVLLPSESGGQLETSSALQTCTPEAGAPFSYRKPIFVAGTLTASNLARDLPGLGKLSSQRLQMHLEQLDRFNVVAVHDESFNSMAADTQLVVQQFGRQHQSQFVVKIEIQDLTVYSPGGRLYKLMGGYDQRHVLIKSFIYDAENGSLFFSKQYKDTVHGDVVGYPGDSKKINPTYWTKTVLGQRIDKILEDISSEVNEKLACVPLSAKVTAVKGKDIHINAGFLNGIRAGETMRVYRKSRIWASDGSLKKGVDNDWVQVFAVFPGHSVARLANLEQGMDSSLNVGDVVRAW